MSIRVERSTYKHYPVNWKNEPNYSPLIREILEKILRMMRKSVRDSKKLNIHPLLFTVSFESNKNIKEEVVNKFFVSLCEAARMEKIYLKFHCEEERTHKGNLHWHAVVVYDEIIARKSKFDIKDVMIYLWKYLDSKSEICFSGNFKCYDLLKTVEFDDAFYHASYIAKYWQKEYRISFDGEGVSKKSDLNDFQDSLLRMNEVLELLKIGRSTFYRGIKQGIYPKPYKIGVKTSVWKKSEIINVMKNLDNKTPNTKFN